MRLPLLRPLVVFDLETTGTNPLLDRVVEFAAVKMTHEAPPVSLHRRINPERAIPPEATAIHGITNEAVADAPVFSQVARELFAFMSSCDLAGFGVLRFDIPLLCQEFRRAGLEFDTKAIRVIDAQRLYHLREPRTLAAALQFYCGSPHVSAHSAEGDVQAVLKVLDAQLERYPDLPRDVAALDAICNPRDPDAVDSDGKLRWRGDEVVVAFGQKSGMTLRQLAVEEPGYLRWILNKDFSTEVKDVVRGALDGRFPVPPRPSGA